jgi:hypothetical protein
MSSTALAAVFCFPILVGCLPLLAQSSNYHLEFDDRLSGHQRAVLVNDSEKSIEAYAVSQRCQKLQTRLGDDAVDDILQGPLIKGTSSAMRDANGKPPRSGVLETRGRWDTSISVFAENGDCQTHITAVLFSDGSFEGEDAAVRGLKAHRDGLAEVSITGRIGSDGSTLDALLAEVRHSIAEDQTKQRNYPLRLRYDNTPQPLWLYWSGRIQVGRTIEINFPTDLSQEKSGENFLKVANEINQWKKKIDSNLALQKLKVGLTVPLRLRALFQPS